MRVKVFFHSYFKDLAGTAAHEEELPGQATIQELLGRLHTKFPKLTAMKNSTLIAVGVEYQPKDYQLREGDEVSLFPPVQGG